MCVQRVMPRAVDGARTQMRRSVSVVQQGRSIEQHTGRGPGWVVPLEGGGTAQVNSRLQGPLCRRGPRHLRPGDAQVCSDPPEIVDEMNTDVYLDVMRTKVLPWIKDVAGGRPWVCQQDSAPCHVSKKSMD